MHKSGWYLTVPAAFLFVLNISLAGTLPPALLTAAHFALLFFIFLFFRTIDLRRILPIGIAAISGLLFTYGFLQKFWLFPRYLEWIRDGEDLLSRSIAIRIQSGRIFTIFALPTLYAIVCAVLIIYILHFLIRHRGKARWAWGGLLVAGLANLLLTQSFGGVVYLAAGVLTYLLFSGILSLRILAPALMTISLFLFVITGLRFTEARRLDPVRLRLSNWQQAVRLVQSSPLFGIGLGNYASEVSTVTRSNEARSIYAHNALLQEVAETGLLFNLFLVTILWRYRRRLRPMAVRPAAHHLAVFIILIVYNLIDIGIYFFAAGFLLVTALSQIYRRDGPPRIRWLIPALPLVVILIAGALSRDTLQEGRILLARQRFPEATASFTRSLGWNPWNSAAHMGLGMCHLLNHRLPAARLAVDRALSIQPGAPYGHFLMSRIRFAQERYQDALFHADRAALRRPGHAPYIRWATFLESLFANENLSTTD